MAQNSDAPLDRSISHWTQRPFLRQLNVQKTNSHCCQVLFLGKYALPVVNFKFPAEVEPMITGVFTNLFLLFQQLLCHQTRMFWAKTQSFTHHDQVFFLCLNLTTMLLFNISYKIMYKCNLSVVYRNVQCVYSFWCLDCREDLISKNGTLEHELLFLA